MAFKAAREKYFSHLYELTLQQKPCRPGGRAETKNCQPRVRGKDVLQE